MEVFKKEFSGTDLLNDYKQGLVRLVETLATMGMHPEGLPITVVPPGGAVKSFFVGPMQLGYQEDDALKGACSMY